MRRDKRTRERTDAGVEPGLERVGAVGAQRAGIHAVGGAAVARAVAVERGRLTLGAARGAELGEASDRHQAAVALRRQEEAIIGNRGRAQALRVGRADVARVVAIAIEVVRALLHSRERDMRTTRRKL